MLTTTLHGCIEQELLVHLPMLVNLGLTGRQELWHVCLLRTGLIETLKRFTLGPLDRKHSDWDMFDINETAIIKQTDIVRVYGAGKEESEQLRDHFGSAKRLRHWRFHKVLLRKEGFAVLPTARLFDVELSYGFCENVTELQL